MATYEVVSQVPAHVPPGMVFDYDVFDPGPRGSDFHEEIFKLKQRAPAIFWTPYNEGHWYVTDAALARELLSEPARFSNRKSTLPASLTPAVGFIPVNLDPPEHGKYRALVAVGMSRKVIAQLEPQIRALAIELIAELQPQAGCEFMADFAAKLPVISFLRLFDLPLDDRPWLLEEVGKLLTPGSDKAAQLGKLAGYLMKFIAARRTAPGTDFISWLGQQPVDGEQISEGDQLNMCTLLLIGGLDSVANTLGFVAKFLAENPAHRRQIIDQPSLLNDAVEEMLRRFPTTAVGTGRLCLHDTELGGAPIKAGEMVMTATSMLNFDAQTYPDPLGVDFSRKITRVGTFSEGPHRCIGAGLARLEVAIFVEEWLKRIPDFKLADKRVEFSAGANISYDRLVLSW